MTYEHIGRGDLGGLERGPQILDDGGRRSWQRTRIAEPKPAPLSKATVRVFVAMAGCIRAQCNDVPFKPAAKITVGTPLPAISRFSRRRRPIFTNVWGTA